MKYSNFTWGLLAVFAVLMVAAFGQNMGLFALGASPGYMWNDNDVLNQNGGIPTLPYPTWSSATLYTKTFTTDDDYIRIESVASSGGVFNNYVHGEYNIEISDGVKKINSGRLGTGGKNEFWYANISEFNKQNLIITVYGKAAFNDFHYQNGYRGASCHGDCQNRALKLTYVGISSNKNDPPFAKYSIIPSQIIEGESAIFDASASSSPWGAELTYLWNFGDGSISTGQKVSHAYDTAGLYVVMLTVNDGINIVSTEDIIRVERFGADQTPPDIPPIDDIEQPELPDIPPINDTEQPTLPDNTTTFILIALAGILVVGIVVITYSKKR